MTEEEIHWSGKCGLLPDEQNPSHVLRKVISKRWARIPCSCQSQESKPSRGCVDFFFKLCLLVFQCGLKRLHEWGNIYRKKVKSMWVCKMQKKMYSEGWATAHRKMFIDFLFFMVIFSKNKKALSQGWECSSVDSVCVACMKPWSLSSTKQARGYMIKIPALRR